MKYENSNVGANQWPISRLAKGWPMGCPFCSIVVIGDCQKLIYIPKPDGATSSEIAVSKDYPFVENTLGKQLEAGSGLSVYCGTCKRSAVLNVAAQQPATGAHSGGLFHFRRGNSMI
jgi:hypothetical protein